MNLYRMIVCSRIKYTYILIFSRFISSLPQRYPRLSKRVSEGWIRQLFRPQVTHDNKLKVGLQKVIVILHRQRIRWTCLSIILIYEWSLNICKPTFLIMRPQRPHYTEQKPTRSNELAHPPSPHHSLFRFDCTKKCVVKYERESRVVLTTKWCFNWLEEVIYFNTRVIERHISMLSPGLKYPCRRDIYADHHFTLVFISCWDIHYIVGSPTPRDKDCVILVGASIAKDGFVVFGEKRCKTWCWPFEIPASAVASPFFIP